MPPRVTRTPPIEDPRVTSTRGGTRKSSSPLASGPAIDGGNEQGFCWRIERPRGIESFGRTEWLDCARNFHARNQCDERRRNTVARSVQQRELGPRLHPF